MKRPVIGTWRFALTVSLLLVVGCADAPGVTKPLPLDYQEQQRATDVYHRNAGRLNGMDGVYSTYLTTHNNPRRIIVVVRDNDALDNVERAFGTSIEGVTLDYRINPKAIEADGGIKEVPTITMPTTWWGKVLLYLEQLPEKVMGAPPPEPAPKVGDKQI